MPVEFVQQIIRQAHLAGLAAVLPDYFVDDFFDSHRRNAEFLNLDPACYVG